MSTSHHPDPELAALGRAVRQLREQHGTAPGELAAAAGIARERLDALEAGRLDPAYDLLLAVALGLGVQLEELVRRARELSRSDEP